MGKFAKLICSIRNNPKDVRFEDACKVAEELGFTSKGGKGSHNVFSRTGERIGLNFRRRQQKLVQSNRCKTGPGKAVAGRPVASVA